MNDIVSNFPSILIVGMNGFIGRRFYNHFSSLVWKTLGTSHIHDSGPSFHFDLYRPDFTWFERIGRKLDYAVICSAMSNIEQCKKESSAYEFNVINTIALIDHLYHYDIIPVFLSSNMVFKGTNQYYHEEEGRYPTTTYGLQKREVEDYLLDSRRPSLILRLCKVIGVEFQDGTLLTEYLDYLSIGHDIICARDQYLSLTHIGDLIRAMQILMEAKACGIFHISSIETFTRLELAIRVARFFNLDLRHIVPCLIDDFDFSEPRPKYNSLDTTKIIGMYEFEFTNLHDCLSLITMNDLNTHPIKQAINF